MRYTKELLHEMYTIQGLSLNQIAETLNGSREAIRKAIIRHGIELRPKGCIYREGQKYEIYKEDLEREYLTMGRTQDEIAKAFGCGSTLIFNLMRKYDIPARPRKEHLKGRSKTLEHRIKLSKSHKGKSVGAINKNWKGGVSTDHAAIRRRSENTNWRKWILAIKGSTCEVCGKNLDERCHCCDHRPDKHVHHVKDFALHPELRFDPSNALVLCESCHRKQHKK